MILLDYIDAVCEVRTMKNDLILTGRIKKITAEGIEIHDPPNAVPIIAMDTAVKVELHKAGADLRVLTGRVYISNRAFLRVVDILNFADYEKRRYFRLDIDHSAELILRSKAGESDDVEDLVRPVRVKNISLCGLLMESNLAFVRGEELKLRMALFNNKQEMVTIVVRRIQKQQRGDKILYGCEITEISVRAEQSLCAFLFREQQEQIRRSRDLRNR